MSRYITWGFCHSININASAYVFISGLGEFLGMFFFIMLLVAVGLNFNLKKSQAKLKKSYGWIVLSISISLIIGLLIALGFQVALFSNYFQVTNDKIFDLASLALNPAIVIAYMLKGTNYLSSCVDFYIPIGNGIIYLLMQLLGAMLGSFFAYLFFNQLIKKQKNYQKLETCFYTKPSIYNWKLNLFNEFFATFILVSAIICISYIFNSNQIIEKIMVVGLIVTGIGYGLGGATGYALNPFRDLGPRIIFYLLFKNKIKNLSNNWKYCPIPIFGPILGSILAIIIFPGFLY